MHELTVQPLASEGATLELVGGKGISLAKLAVAGLPVPPGFLLSTTAYRRYVDENELQPAILAAIAAIRSRDQESIESTATHIQALFQAATLPLELAGQIGRSYATLGANQPAVAVRSSATAEDLPEMSFAGQQDTYLNVRGEEELLDAVRRCWGSLWTARAIGYRMQKEIDQGTLAMGVVVQLMVNADVSGILFTANPSSGDRTELVVNASFGLGEAVVGGQVTPDTYVLDRNGFETKQTLLGSKDQMIVSAADQGTITQPVPEQQRRQLSVSPDLLRELASLSIQVEKLFDGVPQDIEWAAADGKCWLLQARPITKLPPAPLLEVRWDPPSEGAKLIRRQVVENMPEPLSPLFDELYLSVSLEQAMDQMLIDFGMNIDVELFMERPFFLTVNGYAYCRGSYRLSWRQLLLFPKILYVYVTVVPRLLRTLKSQWQDEGLPSYLETIRSWKSVDVGSASDEELFSGIRALSVADANYWFTTSLMVGAAKVTDGLLNRYLSSWIVRGDLTSGMFLRGFPSKTIDAQVELEAIARRIQENESLHQLVRNTPAGDLLETLRQDGSGLSVRQDLDQYLQRYGHQVYNLDFVQPTQIEDPVAVLLSLKTLVSNSQFDTAARVAKLVLERDALIEQTLASLGPVRRSLFRKFLEWANNFGPCREDALFYMGAAWSTLRRFALELGRRLVEAGSLNAPDDIFYLVSAEIVTSYSSRTQDQALSELALTASRRRELRELRKKLHAPGIIPEGSRWKVGPINLSALETQKRNEGDTDTLEGFPVSPGRITGVATVVHSPDDFHRMKPDTILVCPTTTPAWTPLFAHALGLVTDIGGILAHGSIVAREYGIPAVLGTGNGTQRITNGQRITVNGDAGTVTIHA